VDDRPELPNQAYFRIGEVAELVGVPPHVLRYWEQSFPQVRPEKSRGNQRRYRRSDVEALLDISRLVRADGFTLAGARKQVAAARKQRRTGVDPTNSALQSPAGEAIKPSAVGVVPEREPPPQRHRELREELMALRELALRQLAEPPDGA